MLHASCQGFRKKDEDKYKEIQKAINRQAHGEVNESAVVALLSPVSSEVDPLMTLEVFSSNLDFNNGMRILLPGAGLFFVYEFSYFCSI